MVDILITNIAEASKEALAQQAAQQGVTLDAYLREILERLAHAPKDGDDEPLGSWLVNISRPGANLDDALAAFRTAPIRPAELD